MMSDGYFLGVDVGSASVRAGLYSAQGERLSFATRPISQFHASNARVEQSSVEIWQQVWCGKPSTPLGFHLTPFVRLASTPRARWSRWMLTVTA